MKVILFGANGFVGSRAARALKESNEVVTVAYDPLGVDFALDLSDLEKTKALIAKVNPDIIVNCAGVVDRGERARLNVTFTHNICEAVKQSGVKPKKIIICGSASEYGQVTAKDLPISESTVINAVGAYAESKAEETALALKYGDELNVQTVVARIFNPLGTGMPPIMLLPSLVRQAAAIKAGQATDFEVSRLDARRDYIDVRDVAYALSALVESKLRYSIYNIGSGKATTNAMLIDSLKDILKLPMGTGVRETAVGPEALVACQADITRIQEDTGWAPRYSLREALQGVVDENSK